MNNKYPSEKEEAAAIVVDLSVFYEKDIQI